MHIRIYFLDYGCRRMCNIRLLERLLLILWIDLTAGRRQISVSNEKTLNCSDSLFVVGVNTFGMYGEENVVALEDNIYER